MKNKKLFAILTLVCFMFTLMPVAAFAADPAAATCAVKVESNGEWVEDAVASITTPSMGVDVYASVTSSALTTGAAYYVVNEAGEAVQIAYAATPTTTQVFTFKTPGTYKIYAVIDNTAATTGSAVAYGATELEVVVNKANSLLETLTVADAVKMINNNAALTAQIVRSCAYVTVEAADADYNVYVGPTGTATTGSVIVKADNGFSADGNKQVTIRLVNNGLPVVGKVPTISAPDYVTVVPANPKKVVTDATGKITYNISANKPGDFNVVFGYEDADEATVAVDAYDSNIANVEIAKESTNAVNNEKSGSNEVKTGAVVKFTDIHGAVVSNVTTSAAVSTGSAFYIDTQIKVSVVSQPTTSKLDGGDVRLAPYTAIPGAYEVIMTGLSNDLKVGSYEVKFALANGKAVTVGFEAAKMGKTVGIRFVQPTATAELGSTFTTTAAQLNFPVQAYDANGVVENLTYGAGNDYTLSAQGKALATNTSDLFVVSADEKYIGSTITVLAKTTDNKFVATTTLEVVDNGLEVVYANKTAEVGVTTQLKASVVDVEGNKVAVPGVAPQFVVLEKPENAYVNVTFGTPAAKEFTVNFLGSVAGEYKIQTIFIDPVSNEFVTGIETITVGNNEAAFKDVIVMSIGANQLVKNDEVVAMPAAPEIVDMRTMVPARAGLEAFGAVVVWDEATQTVTAELGGVKVVMTIGEKAYTVNGVEKVGDAAPYITAASTMVPVSFFTNAFGITATPIYDANGVCDVLFTK